MRINNIEFRRTGQKDSNDYIPEGRCEIVAWEWSDHLNKETCCTLTWIREDKEWYYLETVGDRFVTHEDMEAVIEVTKYALKILNAEKDLKEKFK